MRTYRACAELNIAAPIESVYDTAVDPALVPRYAPEVRKFQLIEAPDGEVHRLVHLAVGPLILRARYRYIYRRPTSYAGFQLDGRLLHGFFSMTFHPQDGGTLVRHVEGIRSPVPLLARAAGVLVLSRRSIAAELDRLRELVGTR